MGVPFWKRARERNVLVFTKKKLGFVCGQQTKISSRAQKWKERQSLYAWLSAISAHFIDRNKSLACDVVDMNGIRLSL